MQHVRGWKLWWVWHLRGLCVQQCSQLPHQRLVLVGCGLGLGVWQQVQGYLEGCLQQQQQQQQRLRQQVCRLECGQEVCQVYSQECRISSSSRSSRQVSLLG
jgi:hypothetical protein